MTNEDKNYVAHLAGGALNYRINQVFTPQMMNTFIETHLDKICQRIDEDAGIDWTNGDVIITIKNLLNEELGLGL